MSVENNAYPYSISTAQPNLSNLSIGYANSVLSTNTSGQPIWSDATSFVKPSAIIDLRGDNADIIINGVSLKTVLEGIQTRLNMLTPNPCLEREWEELAELGEKYRELEKYLLEKEKTWDILNS